MSALASHDHDAPAATEPVVVLDHVTKRFPGVVANDGVTVAIHPGEVHVLLGENGAGKSTLVGMLSGIQTPDEGGILVGGHEVSIDTPARALALGIGTVFQHAMLVPSLTVAENVALGGPALVRPDRRRIAEDLRRAAAEIGVSVDPDAPVG